MKYKCNEKFSDSILYLNVDSIADLNPGEAKGNSWLKCHIFGRESSGSVFSLWVEKIIQNGIYALVKCKNYPFWPVDSTSAYVYSLSIV